MNVDRDQVQLARILQSLRSNLWLILLGAALTAVAVHQISSRRPPVYSATATLYANEPATENTLVGDLLVASRPPQRGVVGMVLVGPELLRDLEARLQADAQLPDSVRASILGDLRADVRDRRLRTITLAQDTDPSSYRGPYELTARAADPRGAAVLANAAAAALIEWARRPVLRSIRDARDAMQRQVDETTRRLAATPRGTDAYDDIAAVRTDLIGDLSRLAALEPSASGSLSLVASATVPASPVEPRPTRDAVLGALLAATLLIAVLYLRASLDTSVVVEDDLRDLELTGLASVSQVRGPRGVGIARALRQGWSREQLSYLRANLNAMLPRSGRGRVVVMTSAAPDEGKTSLTAALAEAFADAEQTVLVVDADLRQANQEAAWRGGQPPRRARFHAGAPDRPAAATLVAALRSPENLEVLQVRDRVFVLPAGGPAEAISEEAFGRALDSWRATFDLILVDSPPLEVGGDALALATQADGVVLIAESGRATRRGLRRAAERLEMRGARLLGVVLNKQHSRHSERHGLSYALTRADT